MEGLEGVDTVDEAPDVETAITVLNTNAYDIAIIDMRMPFKSGSYRDEKAGLEVLKYAVRQESAPFCIVMTAYDSNEIVFDSLLQRADHYIEKPVSAEELRTHINSALRQREFERTNGEPRIYRRVRIIGGSERIVELHNRIDRISRSDADVLIQGESGTGKELVARAIHFDSERCSRLFLPVTCTAITSELIESELFGHKKGAFTDASEDREGLFKTADGGAIFLDEVGDMSKEMQAKLLRVFNRRWHTPCAITNRCNWLFRDKTI